MITKSNLKFRGLFRTETEEYDIPGHWLGKNVTLSVAEEAILNKWYEGLLNPRRSAVIEYQLVYCDNGTWLGAFIVHNEDDSQFALFALDITPRKVLKKLQKAVLKLTARGTLY